MPLHPQAKVMLEQYEKRYAGLDAPVPLDVRRKLIDSALRAPGPDVAKVENITLPSPGGKLRARLYMPSVARPTGMLVWFHGGGWCVGSIEMTDGTCRHFASGAGCVVLNVEYRLAPETKFPGPVEDCFAATRWAAASADKYGAGAAKLAVGGDSAGGNLAAAVALMARDRHGPKLAFQFLVYPVLDRDFTTRSYQENASGYLLTRDSMAQNWNVYLRNDADAQNPYAAPLRAKDLRGLPSALVVTAEFDPLRDEGEAYARRLNEAAVSSSSVRYNGMLHGFFSNQQGVDLAKQAMQDAVAALKAAFASAWRPKPHHEVSPAA